MSAFATMDQNDFSSMDAKLESLNLQGDIEIYDFDDTFGGDELNDDTFGGSGPIGRDFDFAGQTAAVAGVPESQPPASAQQQSVKAPKKNQLLDEDALLGPSSRPALGRQASASPVPPQPQPQPTFQRGLSVEELEGQMMAAQRSSQTPVQGQGQGQAQPKRVARTLEEVEAEMMAQARAQQQQQQPMPPQSAPSPMPAHSAQPQMPPLPGMFPGMPPNQMLNNPMAMNMGMGMGVPPPGMMLPPGMQQQNPALVQQQQQQMQQQMQAMLMLQQNQHNFPPLGAAGPTPSHHVPQGPPRTASAGPPRSSQGNMTLHQLQALRMNILSRPPSSDTEAMLTELNELILKAEQSEHSRRILASKWAEIAPYNNLMSQSEKDFITRIQIGQLLNSAGPGGEHDPLKDDFYFTVFSAIRGARSSQQQQAQAQAQQAAAANGGGKNGEKRGDKRRQNQAMQKMANQVQRIVNDARQKSKKEQLSLDGALGKIAVRGKSAPKPVLQVSASAHHDAVNPTGPQAASLSASIASGQAASNQVTTRPALTRRQALLSLEKVYDCVLELEQIKRTQPQMMHYVSVAPEGAADLEAVKEALEDSKARYERAGKELWDATQAGQPLGISTPHPFVSLLAPAKGKKLLPRILRHTTADQTLTIFLLMLATFDTLDVVIQAPLLDLPKPTTNPATPVAAAATPHAKERAEAEYSSDLFLNTVAPAFINFLSRQPLKVMAGLLGVFLDQNDLAKAAKSRAGVALLTSFLSRAHLLKKMSGGDEDGDSEMAPDEEALGRWNDIFNNMFSRLQGHWSALFPSTRAAQALPFGAAQYLSGPGGNAQRPDLDFEDETVWSFLAALALNSDMTQQQTLVVSVRDKVLECVGAKQWAAPEVAAVKVRNVNLLLHALGLEASQIS